MALFSITALYKGNDIEEGDYAASFEGDNAEQAEHYCRLSMMNNCRQVGVSTAG